MVLMSGSAAFDPKPGSAAVAAINAAINALAKAFAEQGIKDGVQVNSISPGAVMTGRRLSFFEKWAPAHNLTVEEAIEDVSPRSRYRSLRHSRRDCRSDELSRIACCAMDDWFFCAHGRRRDQEHLGRRIRRKQWSVVGFLVA